MQDIALMKNNAHIGSLIANRLAKLRRPPPPTDPGGCLKKPSVPVPGVQVIGLPAAGVPVVTTARVTSSVGDNSVSEFQSSNESRRKLYKVVRMETG